MFIEIFYQPNFDFSKYLSSKFKTKTRQARVGVFFEVPLANGY